MVKRGESPTGKIYLAAKASGCSSVRELLNKGKEAVADALKLIGTEKVLFCVASLRCIKKLFNLVDLCLPVEPFLLASGQP